MSHEEFAAKVKQWRAAGAPCPADSGEKAAIVTSLFREGVQNAFRQQ